MRGIMDEEEMQRIISHLRSEVYEMGREYRKLLIAIDDHLNGVANLNYRRFAICRNSACRDPRPVPHLADEGPHPV